MAMVGMWHMIGYPNRMRINHSENALHLYLGGIMDSKHLHKGNTLQFQTTFSQEFLLRGTCY